AVVAAVSAIVVASVAVGIIVPVRVVRPPGVIVPASGVPMIRVSAAPAGTNCAHVLALGIHVLGRHGAAAVSVAVDRRALGCVNLRYVSVGIDASRRTAFGGYRLGSCRLVASTGAARFASSRARR